MVKFTEVQEQTRTYYYEPNIKFTVENVVRFAATETTHRLETSDGRKFIINGEWLAIEIETDNWTV